MESLVPSQLLPIIQLAITPVILLSGTGMLILSLTNRMARVVDRTRHIAERIRDPDMIDAADRLRDLREQLGILWHRARLLRAAVTCIVLSMLVSCLLVIVIFLGQLLNRPFAWQLAALFIADMGLLISALLVFLRDIFVSLRALDLEVGGVR
jgi:hypothetical protein